MANESGDGTVSVGEAVALALSRHPYLVKHYEEGDMGAIGFAVGYAMHGLRDAGNKATYAAIREEVVRQLNDGATSSPEGVKRSHG